MSLNNALETASKYISNKLEDGGSYFINLIKASCQDDSVEAKSMIFKCNKPKSIVEAMSLSALIEAHCPVFDYYIWCHQKKEDIPESDRIWISATIPKRSESEISFSLLYIYFMSVTRNKILTDQNERMPAFLLKFAGNLKGLSPKEIVQIISYNNLDRFAHLWVKDINIQSLPISLQNRLMKGIAGNRLFSIIKDYQPTNNLTEQEQRAFDKLKIIANKGPCWEMHTTFQDTELRSISINANLNNLIARAYDEETLMMLVKGRSLYSKPVANQRDIQFLSWDDRFYNKFKSFLFPGNKK